MAIDSSAFSKFLMKEGSRKKIIPYLDPSLESHVVDTLTVETTNGIWKCVRKHRLITRR